jgi:FkbM family methyltransferase
MNRRTFENRIHRWLLSLGWLVQRHTPLSQGWLPSQAYWIADYLRRLRFRPATVIDVGVGYGTPELYEAFPRAELLLVEPVAEFSAAISAILSARKGVHVPVALGAETGERELLVQRRQPLLASFFVRSELERTDDEAVPRRVAVETLDRVLAAHPCSRPYGLKIDAEGAELEVIRGARETLRDTEFVIAEVGVPPRFQDGYRFAEFIAELDRHGFEVCDILDIGRAPSSCVIFLDLVFRRRTG